MQASSGRPEGAAPDYSVLPVPAALCGESPLWDARSQSLCWTDIDGGRLHRLHLPSGTHSQQRMSGRVGCIAMARNNGFIAAMEDCVVLLDDDFRIQAELAATRFDPAQQRFNDGRLDRAGRYFWVGSIHLPRDRKAAGIWRMSPDGRLSRQIGGITTANGIAWSPDGRTMYFADSWHRTIWAADYDAEHGEMSGQRPLFRLTPEMGRPDGAAVDREGYYWCAAFGAARLLRIAPDGRLDREVAVPMRCPTMPAFGGPGCNTLFVTSFGNLKDRPDLADDPMAGHVISLDLDVVGLPEGRMTLRPTDGHGTT